MIPWAYLSPQPKRHLDRFSHWGTAQCSVVGQHWVFTVGHTFSLKIAPSYGRSGPSSNTWFLESTQAHNSNGISIGSAVVAGLTTVTDR